MAQVPTVSAPEVGASGSPIGISAPAGAFGANVLGEAAKGASQSTGQVSDMLAQHAEAFQAINNKTIANQQAIAAAAAVDKLASDYRSNHQGLAMQQNLGQFYKDVEATRSQFGRGLSPMASTEFDQASRFYTYKAMSMVTNDATTARKQTILKSTQDMTDLAAAYAAAHPEDTEGQNNFKFTVGVNAAYLSRPDIAGLTPDEAKSWIMKQLSPVYAHQINLAFKNGNLAQAQQLLDQHKDSMLPHDLETTMGGMRVAEHANTIQSTADAIVNGGAVHGPGTATNDAVFEGLKYVESRGQAGVQGPMTPYGAAHGSTQLLDSTGEEMAKKLGVPWQPDLMRGNTPEAAAYQDKLGRAYFDQAMTATNGNVEDALRYYHGGPDRKLWGPKGEQYVKDVEARVGAGAGMSFSALSFDPKEDPALTLANADAAIQQRAEQAFPNDAVAREQAIQAARQRVAFRINQIDAIQKSQYDSLDKWVISNDVGDPNALKAHDPVAWSQLPPKYQAALERNVKFQGSQVSSDTINNHALLEGLWANAAVDPAPFLAQDVRTMSLTNSDRQHYLGLQARAQKGETPDKLVSQIMGSLEFKSSLDAVTQGEDAATYRTHRFQMAGALKTAVDAWQEGKPPGAKPQPAELSRMLSEITAKQGGGFFGGGHPAFAYPASEEEALRASAAKAGISNPSPYDLSQAYYRHQLKKSNAR